MSRSSDPQVNKKLEKKMSPTNGELEFGRTEDGYIFFFLENLALSCVSELVILLGQFLMMMWARKGDQWIKMPN